MHVSVRTKDNSDISLFYYSVSLFLFLSCPDFWCRQSTTIHSAKLTSVVKTQEETYSIFLEIQALLLFLLDKQHHQLLSTFHNQHSPSQYLRFVKTNPAALESCYVRGSAWLICTKQMKGIEKPGRKSCSVQAVLAATRPTRGDPPAYLHRPRKAQRGTWEAKSQTPVNYSNDTQLLQTLGRALQVDQEVHGVATGDAL